MNCFHCLLPIEGECHPFDDVLFCAHCRVCPGCMRSGRNPGQEYCQECSGSLVHDVDQARRCYAKAQEILARLGLAVPRCPPLEVSARPPFPPHSLPHLAHGKRTLTGLHSERGVWVQTGMPARQVLHVMVHELTHEWQRLNCPPGATLRLLEGLARWSEWQWLLNAGQAFAAVKLYRDPSPIYGGGLRRCIYWSQLVGVEGMLKAVRTASDFPLWLRALSFFKD